MAMTKVVLKVHSTDVRMGLKKVEQRVSKKGPELGCNVGFKVG